MDAQAGSCSLLAGEIAARPECLSSVAGVRGDKSRQDGIGGALDQAQPAGGSAPASVCLVPVAANAAESPSLASSLGSAAFRRRYRTRFAYATGAMYRGIASPKLVVRVGKAGMIGYFGTGGLTPPEIEDGIHYIQSALVLGEPYGANLLANEKAPERELEAVQLLMRCKVQNIEASAFVRMTPAIVLFRLKGLRRGKSGAIECQHNVMAKVSRPEIAERFMSPPPFDIVQRLVQEGKITAAEAEMAQRIPMSHDICAEADSGGYTDGAIPTILLPAMLRLRDDLSATYGYDEAICVGQAGGIGTPVAAAAAFLMGADFILTGSINQCTVDAGTSPAVKSLLQDLGVQDTDYAPAGDMFDSETKVQVLKRGVFFPARAATLYNMYQSFDSLDEVPARILEAIEKSYFKRSVQEVWSEMKAHLHRTGKQQEIARAEKDGKYKMALVFRWYFFHSAQLAMKGADDERVNYQVHTGPALGAFNQLVKGTTLETWTNRHADEIGVLLMREAAAYIKRRLEAMAEIVRSDS